MGSLSKLMQKLDELELPQDVQQSENATEQPATNENAEAAAETTAQASASTEDAPAEQAPTGAFVPDESSQAKENTWQPKSTDAAEASESEAQATDEPDSLIDEADVEALLAEHGPEADDEQPSSFVAEPPPGVSAEAPADEEATAESIDNLIEDGPQPVKNPEASSLFTSAPANSKEPTPTKPLDGDEQTLPWDAAKVDPAVIAFHNRYAAMCEQYRSLRARLFAMNPNNQHQIITVTSSVPEEGKSVTTMNLAICVAEGSQQRVLVVDADFRRASVARMVNAKHSPGMAELILEQQNLDDVIQHTPYPNLKLISAGKLGASSYGELLASPRIPAVFEQLRERFSYVLLDTPPVTTVSDVSMLAPLSDGALMVVEMGRTPEPTVQLAVRTLQTNNVNVLGCVLSRYRDQRKHYYDRYYDYYDRH